LFEDSLEHAVVLCVLQGGGGKGIPAISIDDFDSNLPHFLFESLVMGYRQL